MIQIYKDNSRRLTFHVLLSIIVGALALRIYFFLISVANLPATTDEGLEFLIARAIFSGARPLLFWGAPYQFPIESYLMAPFVEWFPRNAFGARLGLAVLGSLVPFGFLVVFRRTFTTDTLLPLLLIFFPSAYVLTLQCAYFVPQYTITATAAWVLPLLTALALRPGASRFLLPVTGIAAGIALSAHLLSLPLVLIVSCAICLGRNLRTAIQHSFLYIGGLLIGLCPYLLVYSEVHRAAHVVHGSHPLGTGITRFFSPLVTDILKVVIGPELSLFPDLSHSLGRFWFLSTPLMIFFWGTLLAATGVCVFGWVTRFKQEKWPTLTVEDLFVGTCWIALGAFSFSSRSAAGEYRYLLPVAWSFPFVLATLFSRSTGVLRSVFQIVTGCLLLINLHNSFLLTSLWHNPAFFAVKADVPGIGKLKRYLNKNNLEYCFASFWHANRVTFETNERIVCSPPYNDRFEGWPLPYLDRVQQSDRVAWVLNNSSFTRFSAGQFEDLLRKYRVTATTRQLPAFKVYHDFHYIDVPRSEKLDVSQFTIESDSQESTVPLVFDTSHRTSHTFHSSDTETLAVRVTFPSPLLLHRIRLYFDDTTIKNKSIYSVDGLHNKRPIALGHRVRAASDRFLMQENFPIFYQDNRQEISFAPQILDGIQISLPIPDTQLTIREIELYHSTDKQVEPSQAN